VFYSTVNSTSGVYVKHWRVAAGLSLDSSFMMTG